MSIFKSYVTRAVLVMLPCEREAFNLAKANHLEKYNDSLQVLSLAIIELRIFA